MSFSIYLVGYAIMLIGLIMGANLMHVPGQWIGVGSVVLIGIGILHAVASTRHKDPS